MRSQLSLALLLLLPASVAKPPPPYGVIHATRILLDRDHPDRRRFGLMTLVESWRLGGAHSDFGGISSMRVGRDGDVLAVSDRGTIITFKVNSNSDRWPMRLRPVPAGPGPKTGFGKFDRDIESMAWDPVTGRTWLAFEFWNSIWRYTPDLRNASGRRARPREMIGWPLNGGVEAMVRMRDGRFILFSEQAFEPDGSTQALMFDHDPLEPGPRPTRFYYMPPRGFVATDATELPDGRILVLNRHSSLLDGLAAAVTVVDPTGIAPGRVLRPKLVAWLRPPLNIDNMEALSVTESGGHLYAWIASDDNFTFIQQTLLLKFEIDPKRF